MKSVLFSVDNYVMKPQYIPEAILVSCFKQNFDSEIFSLNWGSQFCLKKRGDTENYQQWKITSGGSHVVGILGLYDS